MATTAPEIAISPITDGGLSMGHLALHYGKPEDGPTASRLLQIAGLRETQVLPLPSGSFYRFVVSGRHFARGDGIIYLSCLPEPQQKLIAAIHAALRVGTDDEHEAVKAYRAMMAQDFEASFHFGFLVESLEELEKMVLTDSVEKPTAGIEGSVSLATIWKACPGYSSAGATGIGISFASLRRF